MSSHTNPKEYIWVLSLAWRAHGVCTGYNAEEDPGEEGGSICMGMGMGEREKFEVEQWVAVPQAFGDPETLAGKKESLAHLHGGFLGGNMVDTETGLAGDKESIQEPWEGGMVLREGMMKSCPTGSLVG